MENPCPLRYVDPEERSTLSHSIVTNVLVLCSDTQISGRDLLLFPDFIFLVFSLFFHDKWRSFVPTDSLFMESDQMEWLSPTLLPFSLWNLYKHFVVTLNPICWFIVTFVNLVINCENFAYWSLCWSVDPEKRRTYRESCGTDIRLFSYPECWKRLVMVQRVGEGAHIHLHF